MKSINNRNADECCILTFMQVIFGNVCFPGFFYLSEFLMSNARVFKSKIMLLLLVSFVQNSYI